MLPYETAVNPSGDEMPVRERLLQAAKRLFAEKGYAHASIQEITTAAGVTKPMVYYYFDDKEALLEAIMVDAYARLDRRLAELAEKRLTPSEQLAAIAELTCELAREDPEITRFTIGIEYGPRGDLPKINVARIGERTFSAILAATTAGLAQGELTGDPFTIAAMLYGSVHLHVLAQLSRPEMTFLRPGLGRELTTRLMQGIAAKDK
jgi:AcrR family transcriptional regulator